MSSFLQATHPASLFKDQSVLSPHYVPPTLPFREQHIQEILSILSPALKCQKPYNLFIYGKTGTGKTCVTKRAMELFNNNSEKAKAIYVNCRIYNSRYRIIQKLLKQFLPELEKSGFGLPFLYEKLVELLNTGCQLILILDEIDMVKDLDDLVYTLTRVNDEIKAGGLTIIGISNKLSFKDALDPRSRSSLYETEMVFSPYTADQLQQILLQRAALAFHEDVVVQPAINLIAALTAQENGDARYALKLLSKAAETAEQNGKRVIDEASVESAVKKVDREIISEILSTLPENHQIVLYAIAKLSLDGSRYTRLKSDVELDYFFSGEVYDEYEHVCKQLRKKPRSVRWYHEYLNDLEMLGLITTTLSSKGVRGHTTLIKLGYDAKDVAEITRKMLFGE
jgi:cell division control protein 6